MFASVLFQFLNSFDAATFYVAKFESNVLMSVAWASSGAWVFFFGLSDSPDPSMGLGFAAFFLLLASITALSAVFTEQGFRKEATLVQIFTISAPFSIYAAWLTVAASLSIGVFFKSTSNATQPLCERDPSSPAEPLIPDPEGLIDTLIPLIVAVFVSVIAVTQYDPAILLPVLWAICFMKLDSVKIASIVLLLVVCVVTAVLMYNARL